MKIGLLGPAHPFRGGIAQFLHNMADNLSENHEIIVFNFKNQYPNFIFPGKDQYDNSDKSYNYPIYRLLTPYNPFTWKKTADFIIKSNIEHLIIKFWIPFFCPSYIYIMNYLKIHSNIKIHLLCHNIIFHEYWLFSKYITNKMLLKAHNLIVLSENVYSKLPKMKTNILKLFHPIYNNFLEQNDRAASFEYFKLSEKPTVLFFGFIKNYKGLDVFLKSIPLIAAKQPNIRFVIAGEIYGRAKQYLNILNSFKNQYDIIFHDFYITTKIIPHYFNIADIVVVPYKTATQSGVIQLSYAFNKPVIASNILGLNDMIVENETGYLFETNNHFDLSEKVLYSLENSHIDYKRNIMEFNKQFTWDKFTERLIKFICNVTLV